MKTISLLHSVVALVVTIVVGSHAVTAQNTFTPEPIQTYHSGFWGTDVFADAVPVFALGHQWGAARLDKVNTALKMNVTSQNWGYLNSFAHQMYQLGDGHHDTNYVVWASPLWHTPGPFGSIFRQAWYGLRWEPAEHAWTDRTWEPRDEDSWPFGFQAKHHGTIPTSTADENYRRFVLDTALMSATQVKVLDSVELRNYFRIHRGVNWKKPFEEKFVEYVTGTDTTFREDSTDGRRWQVVINLRRSDEADTMRDDDPVVSLVIPYNMRWKDQDPADSVNYNPHRQRMPFRLVPMTSRDSAVALPMDRGFELPMQQPGGGYQDSIVITRRMLPLHSDTGSPDITVVAEFRVDTIFGILIDDGDTTFQNRVPHILKSSYFDFPIGPDSTLVDIVAGVVDSTKFNKRYRAIDSLGVTVWYHGKSSVAIRAVSILTPLTKRATSGHYDTAIANRFMVHRDSIKRQIDTVHNHTGRTIRLLAFYGNDEFDVDQLVGMRYKLDLLDRRLTSETGFAGSRRTAGNERSEYGRQKFHGFPSKFLWTSGTSIPSRATAAPYVARRNVNEWSFGTNMPVPSPLMSLKLGYRWADTKAPFRSYETDISTNHFGTWTKISLPFPTSPNYQSIEAYENFIHSDAASVGPATMQEHATYVHMYQTGDWYFKKRRYFWSNFFYHMDPKYGFDGSGRPYVRHEKFQPLTGEAVRLGHGMALNLGTRGFMYDKWQYQDDLSRGDTAYRVPHPDDVSDPSKYGREIFSPTYFPGYVTEDSTAHAMDANAQVSVDSLFNSEHLGGDYFTTTDRININDWTPLATLGDQMELSRFMSGTPGARIYAGRRSVRHETKWWHDLVTDTVTAFRHGTAPSNAQLFMKTRPIAWFGKGYRILVNGDTSRFGSWLPGFADSLAVYRWTRTSPTDTTLRYEEEPQAEQLYDLVLLDTSEAGYTGDQCILAVTNRRTSPMLFNASMLDSVEWVSSYEHDTLTRGSRPDLRYRQVGARRIMLPLHHAVSGSGPWLLRVRELHPYADSALAMDTIVGARTTLALDLRPGETKYLHITRQRAHDTAAAGYLAFSTQNKLVATEVVNAAGNGYTGQVRYHMVYHRKRIGSGEQGPWTVYYQRSVPQARDAAPDVAGMQWETPIALSRMTMLSTPSTTGLSHTRYYGVDSTTYEELVHDDTSSMQDCSCGFPSIVVRDTQQYKPVVYVVYACEDMWAMTNRNNYFHIVENAFADTETLNAMALETNGRSLAIAPKDLPHDGGLDTLKSLARYGTPVVNASADGNMYYAWSAANMGIGVGRKSIREQFFRGPQAMAEVPMPDIVTGTGDTLFGGGARLPSVNVYSNIAHGRTDATLVWQEGDAYPHVRYTRLVPGINGAIARMLPDFVEMSYYAYSPSGIPTNAAAAVAVVGGTRAETAELPTVVRSLQTDTLSMFIRDSTVNLNNIVRYEHETVSWEEYVVAEQRGKARYNHFIDRTGYGADELHYWQANATGGIGLSVFHPVVTNGVVRIDSLVWQGTVGGSLQTYHDSLRVLRGNLSDSSLIVNYSILPNAAYTALRAQRLAGNASYWTGMAGFAGLKTQQITIRRIPGVPGIYGITYHDDTLQAGGAWPHLSMRQREDHPKGMASVRRTLQHTADAPPNLIASAEQLYKPTSDEPSSRLRRMHSGGLDVAGERFVARIDLSDGRSLTMLPVYTTRIPADYEGTEAIRHTMAALSTSSQEFLSDAFMVDGAEALQLVTTGGLRDAVDVTLEEVDRERLGTSAATMRGATSRAFTLVPAAADDRRPDRQVRAMYYLSGAEETFYRVRVRYHGDAPVVYRTETILDAAPEDMERATGDNVHTIDLRAMRGHTVPADGLLVTPNPSAGDVTIILPPGRRDQALMWVYDAVGKLVTHVDVSPSQRTIDVHGLDAGSYIVRLRSTHAPGRADLVQHFVVVP